ncbi:Hpt domain-containing protein [Novosphingobium sp. G106]|uniref:Hpt domain-containing protein n=1 Tax=Novosphingobium sp. G106 TaxID=2849500 RepID=UPI0020C360C5|nr:Hpt domain-containing protein [Novosphingobium sp. G106]
MDELLEQFLIESRDLIAVASNDFTTLARNPHGTGSIDSAFRAIHTLKGSVALFAMQPAEQVLHAAEDILERARKGTAELDEATVAALVICLDQIDRWVDDLEQTGALRPQASEIAGELIDRLASASPSGPTRSSFTEGVTETWASDLSIREAQTLAASDQPVTAFRYTPDQDCFFREMIHSRWWPQCRSCFHSPSFLLEGPGPPPLTSNRLAACPYWKASAQPRVI